jgi:predicted nucleic acid-binding protein
MSDPEPNGRLLVETNVLIYATLENDPRHARAREVLGWRDSAAVELFVSVQNLAEMYPNLTGPKNNPPDPPGLARRKIESIARLSGITVLPVQISVQHRALELCERHNIRRQRYFDAQLAASMLDEGIETILTENSRDFADIPEIRAVNPFG